MRAYPAILIGMSVEVMRIATGEEEEELDSAESAAAELGSRGGNARAAKMTPERRTEITRNVLGQNVGLAKQVRSPCDFMLDGDLAKHHRISVSLSMECVVTKQSNIVVLRPAEAGAIGGKKRAERLSPEQRREIAAAAARARWDLPDGIDPNSLPKAEFRGDLRLGAATIPCAVLDNGQRVLSDNGVTNALLGSRSGASKRARKAAEGAGPPLPLFLAPSQLYPFIDNDLVDGPLRPILYRDGSRNAVGYDPRILRAVCEIWLRAREAGALQDQQLDKAQRAEILIRSLADVAIIALIDEATGYQEVRARDELHQILEAYITKELLPWTKRFPDEFFKEMFRVWGWPWPPLSYRGPRGPRYAGKLVPQLIYENLPPGVLERLDEISPPDDNWQRRYRFPQALTEEIGQTHLDKLVAQVTLLFRLSDNPDAFWRQYRRAFPKRGQQLELLSS